MTNTPTTPAGWYPDPAGSGRSRWWNGAQWTENFQTPYTGASAVLTAPAGTPVYGLWIWLVVFVPYISLPLIFTIDFSAVFSGLDATDPNASNSAQLALMTSPGYLLSVLVGWLASGAAVLFSWRDWRWLGAAGVQKPFHWAWGFASLFGYPVYAIGRAIITRRRTGRGMGVLWAVIGMFVVTFVVVIGWAVALVGSMLSTIPAS